MITKKKCFKFLFKIAVVSDYGFWLSCETFKRERRVIRLIRHSNLGNFSKESLIF